MDEMRVRFWGVRGSIPAPGPSTIGFGGNTACVAVHCGARLVVLDAGSGLRALGHSLAAATAPIDIDLLLTHCHIDHIIGLPFFGPAFAPSAALRFWAGHLTPHERLDQILAHFMIPPLLPITPETFRANITFRDFPAGDTLDLGGGISVATARLNHPGGATGYRIDYAGHAVCYLTDNEHRPGGPDPALVALARGADLLIYDAMYTSAEYQACRGWGHSTWAEGVRLAEAADVGQLALFHHAPERDDAALQAIEDEAAAARPGTFAAREGLEILLGEPSDASSDEPVPRATDAPRGLRGT